MKAAIKNVDSPDIREDFHSFLPDDSENFGFYLELEIGPDNQDGSELFGVTVCTPQWLSRKYGKTDVIIGRHYLIVFEYDFDRIMERIRSYVQNCQGENWNEIAQKVGRLAHWEFEDYRPHPSET